MAVTLSNPAPRSRRWPIWAGLSLAAALLGVVYAYPPDAHGFYPRCLFHEMTGLQCPGCGGLRAAHHLLHGHVVPAFRMNPLVAASGPALLVAGLVQWHARRRGRSLARAAEKSRWAWTLVGVILLFAVLRNLIPALRGP